MSMIDICPIFFFTIFGGGVGTQWYRFASETILVPYKTHGGKRQLLIQMFPISFGDMARIQVLASLGVW